MFGFRFKREKEDPRRAKYASLMKQAMERQRAGDIVGCSALHEEAERLLAELERSDSPS